MTKREFDVCAGDIAMVCRHLDDDSRTDEVSWISVADITDEPLMAHIEGDTQPVRWFLLCETCERFEALSSTIFKPIYVVLSWSFNFEDDEPSDLSVN